MDLTSELTACNNVQERCVFVFVFVFAFVTSKFHEGGYGKTMVEIYKLLPAAIMGKRGVENKWKLCSPPEHTVGPLYASRFQQKEKYKKIEK